MELSNITKFTKLNVVLKNIHSVSSYSKTENNKSLFYLKTMICKQNVAELPEIAKFASELKVDGIVFQPIFKTTKECKDMESTFPIKDFGSTN